MEARICPKHLKITLFLNLAGLGLKLSCLAAACIVVIEAVRIKNELELSLPIARNDRHFI